MTHYYHCHTNLSGPFLLIFTHQYLLHKHHHLRSLVSYFKNELTLFGDIFVYRL